MCELLHTQGDKPKARLLAALIKGAPLPRHEHHGHSAADGRDPSIVKAGKISSRRHLALFRPRQAKRFDTTKTPKRTCVCNVRSVVQLPT
jgi:hypothetical protein